MTAANAQTAKLQHDRFNACVYVYEGPSGSWFVQDETDTRGGCFISRKAALKFVSDEFGPGADIVMAAPSPTSEAAIIVRPAYLQLLPATRRSAANVSAVASAARMKGCWDAAARFLIQHAAVAA